MSKLTVVPTPIGNLEDITLRAIRVLQEADVVLAEDTRTTSKLLSHFNIQVKELRSHHMHNEKQTAKNIVDEILSGKWFALVSDAGTPGISDPGAILVSECIANHIKVECLPGATAFVPALVASGLPTEKFYFEGFLPPKKGRQSLIAEIAKRDITTILYEGPSRILKLLAQLGEVLEKDRKVVVAREISKIFETYHRGTTQELIDFFEKEPPKGEMVVLIEPAPLKEKIHKNKYKKESSHELKEK